MQRLAHRVAASGRSSAERSAGSGGTLRTHRGYSDYSQVVLQYRVAASGRSSAVRSAGSAEIPNHTAIHVEYLPHKPRHRIHTHAHACTCMGRKGRAGRGSGRDARGNHRQLRVPAISVDDVEPINR